MSSTTTGAPPQHPLAAAVSGLHEQADAALDAPEWSLSDDELITQISQVVAAEAKLAATKLTLVREADGRDLGKRAGATNTTAWLKGAVARMSGSAAHRAVKLGKALDTQLTVTRQALEAGKLSVEHVRVIERTIRELPKDLSPELVASAEAKLVEYAERFDPDQLAKLGMRILEVIAPDDADAKLAKKLAADERRASRERELTIRPDPERPGGSYVRGRLCPEGTELLRTATGLFDQPRPTDAHTPDTRTAAQRKGDALVEVLRRFLARPEDLPTQHGNKPSVVVTIPQPWLTSGTGYGMFLQPQTPVSAHKVRELACDAQVSYVWRHVQPGDLQGADRARSFEGKLRRLLELRDGGCAFPSCDRPPSWCIGHHIRHWANGGPTTLNNGVLLCQHHHGLIHQGEWVVRLGDDQLPEFVPPDYIDPNHTPIRNERWRL